MKTARQLGREGLGFAAAAAALGLTPAEAQASDEFTIEWTTGREEAEASGVMFQKPARRRRGIVYPGA